MKKYPGTTKRANIFDIAPVTKVEEILPEVVDLPHLNLTEVVDLKVSLASHTSVFCSNKHLIFGGLLDKKKSKELFEITTENKLKNLEPTGDVPPERTSHSAIVRKITNEEGTKETMVRKKNQTIFKFKFFFSDHFWRSVRKNRWF